MKGKRFKKYKVQKVGDEEENGIVGTAVIEGTR